MSGEERLGFGLAAGLVFAALFFITSTWPNWIELTLGADPDGGSGETEWLLLLALSLAALAAWAFAGWQWWVLRAATRTR